MKRLCLFLMLITLGSKAFDNGNTARSASGSSVSSSSTARSGKSTTRSRLSMSSSRKKSPVVEAMPSGVKRDKYKVFKDVVRKVYFEDSLRDLNSTSRCRAAIWLHNQREKSRFLKDEVMEQFMEMFLLDLAEGCQEFHDEVYTTF